VEELETWDRGRKRKAAAHAEEPSFLLCFLLPFSALRRLVLLICLKFLFRFKLFPVLSLLSWDNMTEIL